MAQSVLEHYRSLRDSGGLEPDAAQARAASVLDALSRALAAYQPHRPWYLTLFSGPPADPPMGLYLYGPVGRGKSLLMDMFFAAAPVEKKRRVHFNAFMQETHARIHEWRNLDSSARRARPEFLREAHDDPIAPTAKRISQEATLLCFDEFQVEDVADAMILGRLFEKLFHFGVVVVATSNTAPDDLYQGGLNRPLFLPFIAMMKAHMTLLALDSPRDYRLERMAEIGHYIMPLGPDADAAMDEAWYRLTETRRGAPVTLNVLGRKLLVPQAAKGVARFSFDQLCGQPLGAGDYLAVARTFHTLLIDRIPKLGPDRYNEARRLTLLVDTLYDERVKLVCSAAVPPFEIFVQGENAASFERAASRLTEMQSDDYARAPDDARPRAATAR